jgi:nicotinamidase-related amidase
MAAAWAKRYAGPMSDETPIRSPLLMSRGETALWVIDVQEKLIPLIPEHETILWNIRRLLEAAHTLEVFVAASEQYPQGLGPTVAELTPLLGDIPTKTAFSCARVESLLADLSAREIRKLLLTGIETHVCIQQTALDMLAAGLEVHVAADAVGARGRLDHRVALERMEAAGAVITTTEAVLFEWCEVAGTPEFKVISGLVRQTAP